MGTAFGRRPGRSSDGPVMSKVLVLLVHRIQGFSSSGFFQGCGLDPIARFPPVEWSASLQRPFEEPEPRISGSFATSRTIGAAAQLQAKQAARM